VPIVEKTQALAGLWPTPEGDSMKTKIVFSFLLVILLTGSVSARAQEPPPVTKNYIAWAQEFLRAMYPDLNGKKHILTAETFVHYDALGEPLFWLQLDVGDGYKDYVKAQVGGCTGSVVPPSQTPSPSNSATAQPVPQKQREPDATGFTGPPEMSAYANKIKRLEDQLRLDTLGPCFGPLRPRQFLTAEFSFDPGNHISGVFARGTSLRNPRAETSFAELVYAHPEMTDDEVTAALKKADVKYGPNDKEAFIRDLPIAALERFLGKLKITSVGFEPLSKDRNNVETWPEWQVEATAKQSNGTEVRYRMSFHRYRGSLTELHIIPPAPKNGAPD
jgi:hypothetical protein